MKLEKVREDLQEIRYYYTHRRIFDKASEIQVRHEVVGKAERYSRIAEKAPPLLFDFYILQGSKKQQKAEEKGETNRVRTIKTVIAVISLILLAALIGYLVFTGSRVSAAGQILPILKTLAEVAYDKTACI